MVPKRCLRVLCLGVLGWAGAVQASGGGPAVARSEPALVTAGRAVRSHREVAWVGRGALDHTGLFDWAAIYDRDTEVPLRMWGPGMAAPGAMVDPALAESWARRFLAGHLAILAPGALPDDFVLVADQLNPSGDVRSVGFAQYADGIAVLGGAISFAFKRDRMIMVGSTALPGVRAALASAQAAQPQAAAVLGQRLAAARIGAAAVDWLAAAGHSVLVRGPVAAQRLIVPIVYPRGAGPVDIAFRVAEQVEVESSAGEPGRWNVFVDAATGAAFAREATLSFASGTVRYDVPDRAPLFGDRHAQPAAGATHQVDGVATTSDLDGAVSWTGNASASVVPGLSGPLVAVTNQAGPLVSASLTLPVSGSVTWSQATTPADDAQLAAFIYASQVKRYAKTRINPALGYLDQQLSVSVNETSGSCNAFSTGDDIHFFPGSPGICENSGRIADVVYHEYGHSIHRHSLIPGVGQFNSAMSEGVADTLAVAMTGDSGWARGLFLSDQPARELNPVDKKVWPHDLNGDVHNDGEIYGETMWDLRTNLEASMGSAAGFAQFLKIYYGTVQRAVDIPSSFAEALVADDDDGDLGNGTPNDCDIIAAFRAHGLFDPIVTGAISPPVRDNFAISIEIAAPASVRCSAPTVALAELVWRQRGGALSHLPLVASGTTYRATIPTQPDGTVVEYRVAVVLSDGTTQVFPSNNPDPYYQFYVGPVTKLWCAEFEDGAADWTHSATPANRDRWEVGPPQGLAGDPRSAFQGNNVLGIALGGDGTYAASTTTSAVSPNVDLHGNTSVHLQYYRWLGVEDSTYDQATISANGTEIWKNATNSVAPVAVSSALASDSFDHIDQEWRFVDLDVSAQAASGKIQLTFGLVSDGARQHGGWNLDQVCLVATGPSCGNGTVEPGEQCDDGNRNGGDGCSATCQDQPAGCCSTGTSPAGPAVLAAIALGGLVRRRRRAVRDQRLTSLR
jgi:MYXO-CTERM domain-containing protein